MKLSPPQSGISYVTQDGAFTPSAIQIFDQMVRTIAAQNAVITDLKQRVEALENP